MTTAHTLRIRCPTWDHLENFYGRKIKEGNVLLARVPFSPLKDSTLTIALELPDGLVIDIEARVDGVRQAPDGRKSAIRMVLDGLDETLRGRLVDAVKRGRRGSKRSRPLSEAPPVVPRTQTGLPVPIPADVPIDEVVPPILLPAIEEVAEEHRERYRALDADLRNLREKAAHEVLGVAYEAGVADIRAAYFTMVKKYHPDVVARDGSPDIDLLASEIFIYVNKAYDRLRDSSVASGNAIAAGPALLPHKGWIADFDDIGTVRPRTPLRTDDLSVPMQISAPEEEAGISVQFAAQEPADTNRPTGKGRSLGDAGLFVDARKTEQGLEPLAEDMSQAAQSSPEEKAEAALELRNELARGEEMLLGENYEEAREHFAKILEGDPRSRRARALYHVAYGHTLLGRDKQVEAMTQFEVALKHDPTCTFARGAKSSVRSERKKRPSLFKRFFGR